MFIQIIIIGVIITFFTLLTLETLKRNEIGNKRRNEEYYYKYLKDKPSGSRLNPNTRLVEWNGVGSVVKDPTLEVLTGYRIGITGQFDGIEDRKAVVDMLVSRGIDIKENRYEYSATMWIVGHGATLGSKKVDLIKPTTAIILADDFVRIVNGLGAANKIASPTRKIRHSSGVDKVR